MLEQFIICPNMDACLDELVHDEQLAVAISRAHIRSRVEYLQSKIFCFSTEQNLYEYPIGIFLTKLQPDLLRQINTFIRHSMEGGLITKWFSESVALKKKLRNIENVLHVSRIKRNQLTFQHIFVGLACYVCGSSVAFVCFLLEKFVYQKHCSTKDSKTWKFLHKLLDGKRHYLLKLKRRPKRHRGRIVHKHTLRRIRRAIVARLKAFFSTE